MPIDEAVLKRALGDRLRPCSACGTNDWTTDGNVLTFVSFDPTTRTVTMGGQVLPVVGLTCRKCGALLLFNAMALGLLTGKPAE